MPVETPQDPGNTITIPGRNPGDIYGFDNPQTDPAIPGDSGQAFFDPGFVPVSDVPGVTFETVPVEVPRLPPISALPIGVELGAFGLGGFLGAALGAYLFDYLHPPPPPPETLDIDPATGLLREVIVPGVIIPIEITPFPDLPPLVETQPLLPPAPPVSLPPLEFPVPEDPYGRPYSDDPGFDNPRVPNPRTPGFPPETAPPQLPGRLTLDDPLADPYGLAIPDLVAQPSPAPSPISAPIAAPFPGVSPLPGAAPSFDPLPFPLPEAPPQVQRPPEPTGLSFASPGDLPFSPNDPFLAPFEMPDLVPPREGSCQCAAAPNKPKKKEKKERTQCVEGRFREYKNGTAKFELKDVPCEPKPKAKRKKAPKYPRGNPFPGLPPIQPLRGF